MHIYRLWCSLLYIDAQIDARQTVVDKAFIKRPPTIAYSGEKCIEIGDIKWHTIGTLAGVVDTGVSEGTGGNMGFWIPAILAVQAVSGVYQFYQSYQRQAENKRYWNDYYENTGVRPKYPYRSGSYSDYGYLLSAVGTGINIYDRVGANNVYR